MMKKFIVLLFAVYLTSCTIQTPLYYWGTGVLNYENLSYRRYDKDTPKVMCQAIVMYEDMLMHVGGSRQVPPPGICAEYAHMLLQEDVMSLFYEHATVAQKKRFENSPYGSDAYVKAMKLLEKEIELYPESTQFIRPLMSRFKQ